MGDGGASVLFHYLFSYGCVGREGDPEYKKEKKKETRPNTDRLENLL